MSLEKVKARTAARKAAGLVPERYPHGGKPARGSSRGPCRHLGRELTGPERERMGLDHRRRWSLCLHEAKPLGEAVCACLGCGPKCPGYPRGGGE